MTVRRENANAILGVGLAGLALLAMYLLSKKGLLHASTSAGLLQPAPGTNVLPNDSITGAPQYDTRSPSTVPEQEAFAIKPIDGTNGNITEHPSNPLKSSCPQGYTLWHNAADNSYWCLPT